MLASITPLGERGRRSRWAVTVTAFLVGAAICGAALGATLGAAGSLLGGLSERSRLQSFAALAVIALALDLGPWGVPGPNRQVNERWLDEFRGWVYGLGFGGQLGLGVTTIVSSATTYLAIGAALLTGDAGRGALIMGCFGLVRGLTPLAAAGVRRPDQLLSFHRTFARLHTPGDTLVRTLTAALCAAAITSVA
jgi:sulfite exporter TauE/SafE